VFQQAQDALFATVPTTPDGMKALISFCVNDKTISASELPDEVLNTLHKSASMMARRS